MQATKFQQELVRSIVRIYAGLYMETAANGITKSDLEKIAYGWNTVVTDVLPKEGLIRTFYFVEGTKKPDNAYDVYIWVDSENEGYKFEKIGNVTYDMKDHITKEQFEELLINYRDVADPIPLEASKYTDDVGFATINYADFVLEFRGTSYSLYDPTSAKMQELDGFFNKTELLSAVDFDSCIDETTATILNALP